MTDNQENIYNTPSDIVENNPLTTINNIHNDDDGISTTSNNLEEDTHDISSPINLKNKKQKTMTIVTNNDNSQIKKRKCVPRSNIKIRTRSGRLQSNHSN
jgi:hypothetical protein